MELSDRRELSIGSPCFLDIAGTCSFSYALQRNPGGPSSAPNMFCNLSVFKFCMIRFLNETSESSRLIDRPPHILFELRPRVFIVHEILRAVLSGHVIVADHIILS